MLLAVAVAAPLAVVGVAAAGVTTMVRWHTGWLVPVTGAQVVLGPAVAVGPARLALASACAAAAVLLATPPVSWTGAIASGTAAAFVAAGCTWPVRIGATVLCAALALGVGLLPWRRTLVVSSAVAGLLAVALVA